MNFGILRYGVNMYPLDAISPNSYIVAKIKDQITKVKDFRRLNSSEVFLWHIRRFEGTVHGS